MIHNTDSSSIISSFLLWQLSCILSISLIFSDLKNAFEGHP